jgi:3-hydroxybutyryl-CoA dehydrogenase
VWRRSAFTIRTGMHDILFARDDPPTGPLRPIAQGSTVAIVGAGRMGVEVAWVCVRAGLKVVLHDNDPAVMERARRELEAAFGVGASARWSTAADIETAARGAALLFENVPEELALKQRVHREIAQVLEPGALQGSNASSLTADAIADGLASGDRFFNANFGHPRSGELLVELMPSSACSPQAFDAATQWIRLLGLVPLQVRRQHMGYAQNRIWRVIKREALRLVDQGVSTVDDVDRGFCLSMGVAMGPFAMMDRVGLQAVLKVEEAYHAASGAEADRPPGLLIDLVRAGHLGISTGRGFYTYPHPRYLDPQWLRGGAA